MQDLRKEAIQEATYENIPDHKVTKPEVVTLPDQLFLGKQDSAISGRTACWYNEANMN